MLRLATHRVFAVVATLLFSSNAWAVGPEFRVPPPGVLELPDAKAGVPYEVVLPDLLSVPGTAPRQWSMLSQPGWLTLDSSRERLGGFPSPSDAGLVTFKLSVRDASGGEPNRTAQLRVVAPPKWDTDKIDLGIQTEGKFFTFQLKSHVQDLSGGTMSFSATNLPTWMTLNATTGTLSGTARTGKYTGVKITATGPGGTSTVEAFGEVRSVSQGPKWVQADIAIDDATQGTAYVRRLDEFVLNSTGAPLSYEIVADSPPSWLNIGAGTGTLSGTPALDNVGPNSVTVRVFADVAGTTFDDVAVFRLTVKKTNRAPRWKADPLGLPKGLTKRAYKQDLLKSVDDPDGDKLTFKIESFDGPGTAWAAIAPTTGVLTGTPGDANVGQDKFRISVTDPSGASATASIEIPVDRANEAPRWNSSPLILASAREDVPYQVDLAAFAKDPDGDPLRFDLLDSATWFQVTPTGKLIGTPGAGDTGLIAFRVRVADGVTGSDVAEVRILVEHVNHAPEWLLNPIVVTVKPGEQLKVDLAPYVRDRDPNDKITFTSAEPPPFVKVTEDGKLLGTITAAQAGDHVFRVRATDSFGAFQLVIVTLQIPLTNSGPSWVAESVQLPNAVTAKDYEANLTTYVNDPDGLEGLRFSKTSGPTWLSVNGDGRVSGKPSSTDAGMNTFRIQVIDPANEFATATVKILVKQENRPPRFRQDPIHVPDAAEDGPYVFDIREFAVDDDGDPLRFTVAGPAWLKISPEGVLGGTPSHGDAGPYTATVSANDGGASATGNISGKVVGRNRPPVIGATLPVVEIKERQMVLVTLTEHVTDPDGDTLTFSLVDTVPWAKMANNGELTLSPKAAQVGDQQVRFRVTDGKMATVGLLKVKVLREPREPIWLENPMRVSATVGAPLNVSFLGKARDLDDLPLFFTKREGPAWATMSLGGDLTGTPTPADTGTQLLTVAACNDQKCGVARVFITLNGGQFLDRFSLSEPLEGASADIVWVVDASPTGEKLARELPRFAADLSERLIQEQVTSRSIVLSANARRGDGMPVGDSAARWVVTAGELSDSLEKAWIATSDEDYAPLRCVSRFLERDSVRREFAGRFLRAERPLEIVIVGNRSDRSLKAGTTLASFVEMSAKRARAGRQPLRLHWLTGCEGEKDATLSEAVAKTAGVISDGLCAAGVSEALAATLIPRARLLSRSEVRLSRTVPSEMALAAALGGTSLSSNNGKLFELMPERDRVRFRWYELLPRSVGESDEIVVTY